MKSRQEQQLVSGKIAVLKMLKIFFGKLCIRTKASKELKRKGYDVAALMSHNTDARIR